MPRKQRFKPSRKPQAPQRPPADQSEQRTEIHPDDGPIEGSHGVSTAGTPIEPDRSR